MASAKKQAQKEGISVQEVECHLDSKLFLDEYPRWRADSPQCPCILQRMFTYAKELGHKECEWTIHWGHQQLVPRADAKVRTPAIQMVGSRTTREEVQGIYNEVYQQKRLPGPPLYGPEQMEALDWDICTSLEEQTWQRQSTARPEEDWGKPLQIFCGPAARPNPSLDPGKAQGPTCPGPQWSQGGTLKSIRGHPTYWNRILRG